MTTVQIGLLISGLVLIIALWDCFEGFITTRQSSIIDHLKRIGDCIDLATEMNCRTEDFQTLLEKVKPTSSNANSDVIKLANWGETMSYIKNVKKVTQVFIGKARQDLED